MDRNTTLRSGKLLCKNVQEFLRVHVARGQPLISDLLSLASDIGCRRRLLQSECLLEGFDRRGVLVINQDTTPFIATGCSRLTDFYCEFLIKGLGHGIEGRQKRVGGG